MLDGILFEKNGVPSASIVTDVFQATGRAMAQTWRPYWQVPLYMLGIAACARFGHYALFEGPLMSAPSFVVDYIVTVVAASAGYRIVRAGQMASQYGWLFERAGPVGWRRKA